MKIVKLMAAAMLFMAVCSEINAAPSLTTALKNEIPAFKTRMADINMQSDSMKKKIKDFKKEWNKKVDKLNASIAKDQKKVKKAKKEDQAKLNDEIQDLKTKKDELKKEIDAAGNKTADNWDEFKNDVSDKYSALDKKVKDFFKNK